MRKTENHSARGAPSGLQAKIVPVAALGETEKDRMFELMQAYYDEVSREQFLADLAKKDDVILLLDLDGQKIRGFSTLVTVCVRQNRKERRGIFSGDTVIEKEFWGQRALGKAFLRYLFSKKLQRPFQPLYWLLISKGYKTYLMMANNFADYFPRYDRRTPPERKALMDAFYRSLYPNEYNPGRGLIEPVKEACHIKTGVAAISEDLLRTHPKIAFFQQANPEWAKGSELACIARMTLRMPLQYALKAVVVDAGIKPLRSFRSAMMSRPLKRANRKR